MCLQFLHALQVNSAKSHTQQRKRPHKVAVFGDPQCGMKSAGFSPMHHPQRDIWDLPKR